MRQRQTRWSWQLGRILSHAGVVLLMLGVLWGTQALACPVCGQAKSEEVNATYVAMTAFMSLTPLALIFGVAAFVVRRIKRSEAEAEGPGESSAP